VTERLVLTRLNDHIEFNCLNEEKQSAYKRHHSTETALIDVQSHISEHLDESKAVLLVLLDLSAAFDTINHEYLIRRLEHDFGVKHNALAWFHSYVCGRNQKVQIGNFSSSTHSLVHGITQGSVLGPVLFSLYTAPLQNIINQHCVQYHKYAADIQLFVPYDPSGQSS
jgi:retron-type reverse transcriptase